VIRVYLITPVSGDPMPAVEAALAVLRVARGSAAATAGQSVRQLLDEARTFARSAPGSMHPSWSTIARTSRLPARADGVHLRLMASRSLERAPWGSD